MGSQVIDFEEWMSPEAIAKRSEASLKARLAPQEFAELEGVEPLTIKQVAWFLRKRNAGELEALIESAKNSFNKTFRGTGTRRYKMVESP
jgi:hypothetical protein